MASEAVKKVQDILFRGGESTMPPTQVAVDSRPEAKLTIQIPGSVSSTPQKQPPKANKSAPDASLKPVDDALPKTFRQVLQEKIGDQYRGAERFRLAQDGERKKHWKKWGPYLSDRQWVSRWWLLAKLLMFDVIARQPCARIIPQMAMRGDTSLTNTLDPVHIAGVKMVSLGFQTITSASASPFRSGTA
jgi:hypothetical protein